MRTKEPFYYILDDAGEPIKASSIEEWGQWFEAADRRLCFDDLGEKGKISTVFLGIDHGFGHSGNKPILFETLVFGGPFDGEMKRYHTRDQAITGHAELLYVLRRSQSPLK